MRGLTTFRFFKLGAILCFGVAAYLHLDSSPAAGDPAKAAQAPSKPIDFARDIRPILQNHCVSCHGPEKQKGGLRLDQKETALEGGDSGKVIVPGNSPGSLLARRIASAEKTERMPPSGERLTAVQVALVRTWIDQGANWSGTAGPSAADAKRKHWAFQPIVRPSMPQLRGGDGSPAPRHNGIDAFVLARLEKDKLSLSPTADRLALLRRLKFDLHGLPPSLEEVDAWQKDTAPDAYERLVERLLANPHFGERWARHWLDVVRFAESDGFETNLHRPNAWPYRDYVIRAFNSDKPYDRFIHEQIAGDALGVDDATGFLVGGPHDKVKSPDVRLTLQQRADELHDMVSTTGSAFLGLTVGCARCHNHKFDPVSQVDYYALSAVFSGVQHGERTLAGVPGDAAARRRTIELREELAQVERNLMQAEPLAQPGGPAGRRVPVNPLRNVELFAPIEAKFVRFVIQGSNSAEPCLDELEVYTAGPDSRNVALASQGTKATSSGNLSGFPIHKLEHINDGQYGNSRSWISNTKGTGWVQLELSQAEMIDRIVWGRDREGKFTDRLPVAYRVETAVELGKWRAVATSEDRATTSVKLKDLGQAKLLARRAELARELDQVAKPRLAYVGAFTKPAATFRLHRGDPMEKREAVTPASLSAFAPSLSLKPEALDVERRLALARWITDARNPLTARVVVNRLWHYHFGQGIVDTPSDFGLNGALPSHPELLDWLAAELMENGWRLKHIHRLIVTSATYRQSSAGNARGRAVDAGSRLLWRYPPRRLEAEPLRDAILLVSGKLDPRMGGPGFDLFEPNSNYVKVYTPKKDFGPAEWRRMIYQSKPRMQLDDTFGAFDCPDGGQIAPKRNQSTTPLQALNLLNGNFVIQQAEFFAQRLRKEAGELPGDQARHGFRIAFGREPRQEEQAAAVALIREHGALVFCRALLNANEFLYVP